jgi:predicted O-methyltransferase YrrM
MPVTPNLFIIIDFYIDDLFARDDEVQKSALDAARGAGLPEIQVSAGQGKFIYLLAKMINAKRVLEIGTLGGYSTIWLARALPPDGRLITLEVEEKHAEIATANIERAGFASQVEIILGPAVDTLPGVVAGADEPFDLVFLDADKVNYSTYFIEIMKRVRSGSLILADNVIREGTVLAPQHHDPSAGAARAVNAMLAADERLEAIVLQQVGIKGHDGIAIARVR